MRLKKLGKILPLLVLVVVFSVSGLVDAAGAGAGVAVEEGGGGGLLGSDLFDDVPVGHWADEEVGWAVSSGVMGGVADGRFDLEGVVPRWQIVTFLFRASRLVGGSVGDEGVVGSDSFGDVPVGHEADREIGWAVGSGITQGVGGGRFGPDGSVDRAQIVTFLFRLTGLVDVPGAGGGLGSDSFVDVPVGHWADEEVGWAVMNGVTQGVGDGRFDLDRVVTRAQIATFLFRVVRSVEGSGVVDLGVVLEPRLLVDRTYRSADWSPDGRSVVFSQDRSLWIVDVDSGDRSLLLAHEGGGILEDPAWSPDGTRIAYTRRWRNNAEHWVSHIYSVNVEGTAKTQLTDGDVRDGRPDWSSDSERIAFQRLTGTGRNENGDFVDADRYVVVIDADGSNQVPLTEGRGWEQSPVWSPDGTHIAYLSNHSVGIVDSDGTNLTPTPTAGAFWGGGVSWSPDGKKLAFARTEGDGSSIVIVSIDGFIEETVTDADGWDTMPRWSPDGQKLLFTRRHPDNTQQLFVVDASGRRTPLSCKPRGIVGDTTVGFPLPEWAVPSIGTARVAVLFLDFPDAEATHSTNQEAELGLPYIEKYLETVSYRQFKPVFQPLHRWLRAEHNFSHYLEESAIGVPSLDGGGGGGDGVVEEAVRLADPEYDFTGIDSMMVVMPGSHFGGGNALGRVTTAEGSVDSFSRINIFPRDEPGEPRQWGSTGAHELVHTLGLADLYPFDSSRHKPPYRPAGVWVENELGLMGLDAFFHASEDDPRLAYRVLFPNGQRTTNYSERLEATEMLAWSRWQLGWLKPEQILCVTQLQTETTITISPVAVPGNEPVMIAIPTSGTEVIVIESRRKLGYDTGREHQWSDGAETTFPGLLEEGVLVYTVNPSLGSGQLPIKVAGDPGNGHLEQDPILTEGETITVGDYTITVQTSAYYTDTITITKTSPP